MAIDRSPRRRGIPQRLATAGRKAVAALGLLGLLLPCQAEADWLGKLVGAAQRLSPAPNRPTKALDNLAAHIKTLPSKPEATVLAAEATPEGHWRFVNKAGETITAGTPEEMKRVVLLLVPDAKAEARLTLYLTQDTVFARRTALKDLPKGTELTIRVGEESYRILRRSEGAGERLFAEIRANLVVELADQQQFAEAAWQLARPLNKAGIRILALEPGSAPRLPSCATSRSCQQEGADRQHRSRKPVGGAGRRAWTDRARHRTHRWRTVAFQAVGRPRPQPAGQGPV